MLDRVGDERQSDPSGLPDGDVDKGAAPETQLARAVRRGMILGAGATITLIGYGLWRFPSVLTAATANPLSACAGIGIAIIYAIIGWFGPKVPGLRDPQVMRRGVGFGLGGSVLFAVSMLGERLVPHDERQNAMIGIGTFGLFFLLLIVAGFSAALTTRRARAGPLAAVLAALIASQLWFILSLAMYYAFIGTAQEARFLEVDQILADFRRNGGSDLRAFIFEDFMGGGFFHSLLAPLLSLPLGLLGGLVAKAILLVSRPARRESHGSDRTPRATDRSDQRVG
jgi:hypothetical protein